MISDSFIKPGVYLCLVDKISTFQDHWNEKKLQELWQNVVNFSFIRQHSSRMRVSVATTRCQYCGGVVIPTPGYTYPPIPSPHPSRYLPPPGDLVLEIPISLPENRLTDTCEKITFPQLLLQAVINLISVK